ncbi:MAG TPA: hypothetical protein PLW86_05795 [Rhodocyclaceae bacterium]|nr:hypothetical protein [Rhodocyclaceae bacterium]
MSTATQVGALWPIWCKAPFITESQMGSLSQESFEEFLESLKKAGIEISNEAEVRERLAESQRWRFAFMTLAANGRPLGIRFEDHSEGANNDVLRRTLAQFAFSENYQESFAATLRSTH